MRHTFALVLTVLACTTTQSVQPAEDPVSETDTAEVEEPIEPRVEPWPVILPHAPRYDDPLYCSLGISSEHISQSTDSLVIAWSVDDAQYEGPTHSTESAGDTVAHSDQSGGQRWRCSARWSSQDESMTKDSQEVLVAHPLPMIDVPTGTFFYGAYRRDSSPLPREARVESELTKPYRIASHEVTQQLFEAMMGFNPVRRAVEQGGWLLPWFDATELPAGWLTWHEAAAFTNALSEADGLEGCYPCEHQATEWTCARPNELLSCAGYRLPTSFEWLFAATEAGRHQDDLPGGGNVSFVEEDSFLEYGVPTPTDTQAVGPLAAPDETMGSQCNYAYDSRTGLVEGGLLRSNALGLYDLCGNVAEYIADAEYWMDDVSGADSAVDVYFSQSPHRSTPHAGYRGGSYATGVAETTIYPMRFGSITMEQPIGIRVAQTIVSVTGGEP